MHNYCKRWFFLLLVVLTGLSCAAPSHSARERLRKTNIRDPHQRERITSLKVVYGKASYYGPKFHGKKTASGEIFDMYALTAAHRNWPFNTICRVTNLKNQKTVIVRINDRGPFVAGRVLDLSYAAARALDALKEGVIEVKIEVLQYGEWD